MNTMTSSAEVRCALRWGSVNRNVAPGPERPATARQDAIQSKKHGERENESRPASARRERAYTSWNRSWLRRGIWMNFAALEIFNQLRFQHFGISEVLDANGGGGDFGHLRGAVSPCAKDNLEAALTGRPHKQERERERPGCGWFRPFVSPLPAY